MRRWLCGLTSWTWLVWQLVGLAVAQELHTSTLQPTSSNWSSFRGPSGQGTSTARGLPTTWSQESNLAWKVALPGAGASSPILWDQQLYVTCYTGFFVPGEAAGTQADLRRHLLCFDKASGQQLWDQAIPAVLPEEQQIRDHGFAASTPVADAQGVICFFGKSGVIAFDHKGRQKWRADVGSKTNGWGSSASPVLYKDLVIINASVESESLVALERATGQVRWRLGGIKEAWNTPVLISVSGKSQLLMARYGKVLAVDPETGGELWNCDTDISWYMVPSLIEQDGVIYCLGGRSGTSSLAVRTGGSGDVTKSHRLWTSLKGSNVSSPVVADDYVYWVNDSQGIAYCVGRDDGAVVYEERLNRAGQLYASALLADGKLYYLTRDGRTFVLAAGPEFKQLAVNDLRDGGVFNGGFAVDGQRLIVRSDKYLYAIDP